MGEPIPQGKLPPGLLARLLGGSRTSPEVLVGPGVGEDACAIEVPGGVLVAASDPITLTGGDIGRYAVLINANDVAVMGVRPRWFLATVLLPPGTSEAEVEALFDQMARTLDELGAVLVGGHTEVTDVVRGPVVVGQMLGLVTDGRCVSTAGARPGDVLVQVGPVPVEGAAVLAEVAGGRLGGLDPAVLDAARSATEHPGISVVDAALDAARLRATALHDPTEGGLASGLHELAAAAGVRLTVDRERVLWFEPGTAVCEALGADPWATIASGSLVTAFVAPDAERAVEALRARGHPVSQIGAIEEGEGVFDTEGRPIVWPDRDEVARLLEG